MNSITSVAQRVGTAAEGLLRSGHRVVVALLLGSFLVAGINSLVRESATFDETAHLPAGYTYLDRRDFRLNPEHPPLAKIWAALPVWIAGLGSPDYDTAAWNGRAQPAPATGRSKASEWLFGYEFINGRRGDAVRNDPRRTLIPARIAMLVLGLALAAVVYTWSRQLWGDGGALLSLFCFCLSPTMLAHARLVTTDLPNALGFTTVLWCFWRLLERPGAGRRLIFGLACAMALLIKFSALLLGPILGLSALLWIAGAGRDDRGSDAWRSRARHVAVAALAAIACCAFGLWAGYGFRFEAAADPAYHLDWDVVGLEAGPTAEALHLMLRARLLPESYLYGLAYFLGGAARRLAYLNGTQSILGWWYYFPETLLLKTPPSTLILGGWLFAVAVARRRLASFNAWYLALPVAVYLGVSMASNLNIGHRHLAAIYPPAFVLLGGLATHAAATVRRRTALALLLAGSLISFAAATPGYLSYFNFLAGGPAGGARFLLDSNLDWGQDLPRLKRFMDREGIPTVYLAYFGTADPAAYGIDYHKVHRVHDFDPGRQARRPGPGDYLAVSVNLLYGLYFDDDREVAEALAGRGWVTRDQVRAWLDQRAAAHAAGREHPGLAAWLVERGVIDSGQKSLAERDLTSAWLRRIRQSTTPVHRAGDSIMVYRVPSHGI